MAMCQSISAVTEEIRFNDTSELFAHIVRMKYVHTLIYMKIDVFTGKFDRGFMNKLRSARTQIYIKSKTGPKSAHST